MLSFYTERNRAILTGAIGIVLLSAVISIGIKGSFGAFAGGYELRGSFAAAGQGLMDGSDVKIRGVNVGEVKRIELVDGRAQISLRMNSDIEVPVDAEAAIRAKTLFGEKFVDIVPGDNELTGPYLSDGETIERTLGGVELEAVLIETFPVFDQIDPVELGTVITELATAGAGLGENIERTIANAAILAELQASNDPEISQFLSDFDLLTTSIDAATPDLLRGADALNAALPTLIAGSDDITTALVQLARLSDDVAELLEANESFTTNVLTNGSTVMQLLFDERHQLPVTLLGIQQFTQTFADIIRFEAQDGSMMAAVKNLLSLEALIDGFLLDPGEPTTPDVPANTASPGPAQAPASSQGGEGGGVVDQLTDATTRIVEEVISILVPGGGGR